MKKPIFIFIGVQIFLLNAQPPSFELAQEVDPKNKKASKREKKEAETSEKKAKKKDPVASQKSSVPATKKTDTKTKSKPKNKKASKREKKNETPSSKKEREITVHNAITKEILAYQHWTGKYEPNFTLSIKDQVLNLNQTSTIKIENNELPVEFEYDFAAGYRTGKERITFEVPEVEKKLDLSFSWHDDFRVIINNAKPKKRKELASNVAKKKPRKKRTKTT